jgi:hypothetical protein
MGMNPSTTAEKETAMNYTTAICLISDDVRGIAVSYELPVEGVETKLYTFKSLDKTIRVGNLVIIPTDTRHGFTVVEVQEIDVEIPIDSTLTYKWIAAVFSRVRYDTVLEEEAHIVSRIKSGHARKQRSDIRATLEEELAEELPKLTSGLVIEAEDAENDVLHTPEKI